MTIKADGRVGRWTACRDGLVRLALAGLTFALASCATAPEAPVGWTRVWSDEFDGRELDRSKWDFDLGNGFYNYGEDKWIAGWGNRELQTYTRDTDNVFVQDGMLHLRAVRESRDGFGYSSGRLKSQTRAGANLFSQTYGRFEIRAKLPTGQGLWPALWMLPREHGYGSWAASGEIDIMEARGAIPGAVTGALHFGSAWDANASSHASYRFPTGQSIAEFHVYALEWEPGEIRWYVDGALYARKDFWWSSARVLAGKGAPPLSEADLHAWPAPFDRPFYLIMNLAVGGDFGGQPDASTPFPAEMLVDYVRVYQRHEGYSQTPPARGEGKLPF